MKSAYGWSCLTVLSLGLHAGCNICAECLHWGPPHTFELFVRDLDLEFLFNGPQYFPPIEVVRIKIAHVVGIIPNVADGPLQDFRDDLPHSRWDVVAVHPLRLRGTRRFRTGRTAAPNRQKQENPSENEDDQRRPGEPKPSFGGGSRHRTLAVGPSAHTSLVIGKVLPWARRRLHVSAVQIQLRLRIRIRWASLSPTYTTPRE